MIVEVVPVVLGEDVLADRLATRFAEQRREADTLERLCRRLPRQLQERRGEVDAADEA
jgi:hypothetical protein